LNTPLIIDDAAYQDIVIREGSTHVVLLEFVDSENNYIDLTDYDFKISLYKKSRQVQPDLVFEGNDFSFIPQSGSIYWNIAGDKTLDREGVYLYYGDLIDKSTNSSLTCMYGMFTIINRNK
jgi:hypothetical protein